MIINKGEWDRELLNDLIARAEIFASQSMMTHGRVHPALFIQTDDGPIMLGASGFSNEESKDRFVTAARLVCIAHGASATVLVSESWVIMRKDGKDLDLSKMPSQCPDRQEMVTMMGEAWQARCQKLLPIIRSSTGRFVGFGEGKTVEAQTRGRFADFLPNRFPSQEDRELAKKILHQATERVCKQRDQGEERGWAR